MTDSAKDELQKLMNKVNRKIEQLEKLEKDQRKERTRDDILNHVESVIKKVHSDDV